MDWSVSVAVYPAGFLSPLTDEIRFGGGIGVSAVLVSLPQFQLQRFVFLGGLRMLVQIVAEIQLVVISCVSEMDVINLIRKALFCIPFIE